MKAKTLNDAFCKAYLECPQNSSILEDIKNLHKKGLYAVYSYWMKVDRNSAYTNTIHHSGYFNCLPVYIKSFIEERKSEVKQYEKEMIERHEEA